MPYIKLHIATDWTAIHISHLSSYGFLLPREISDVVAFNDSGPVVVLREAPTVEDTNRPYSKWLVPSTENTTIVAKTTDIKYSFRYLLVINSATECAKYISLIATIESQLHQLEYNELILYTKAENGRPVAVPVIHGQNFGCILGPQRTWTVWKAESVTEIAPMVVAESPDVSQYTFTINNRMVAPLARVDGFASDGGIVTLLDQQITVPSGSDELIIRRLC